MNSEAELVAVRIKIKCKELQDYLNDLREVQEAAVMPGEAGEIVAFVVPRQGVKSFARLEELFRQKLGLLELKGTINYLDDLPRSGTGKLFRRELTEKVLGNGDTTRE